MYCEAKKEESISIYKNNLHSLMDAMGRAVFDVKTKVAVQLRQFVVKSPSFHFRPSFCGLRRRKTRTFVVLHTTSTNSCMKCDHGS